MKKVIVSVLLALSFQANATGEKATCQLSATEGRYSIWFQSGGGTPRVVTGYNNIDEATALYRELVDGKVCEPRINPEPCQIVPRSATEFALYRGGNFIAVFTKLDEALRLQNKLVYWGACTRP